MSEEKKQTQNRGRMIAIIALVFFFVAAAVFFFMYMEVREDLKNMEVEKEFFEESVQELAGRVDSLHYNLVLLQQKNKNLNKKIGALKDSLATMDSLLSTTPDSSTTTTAVATVTPDSTVAAPTTIPKKHWRDRLKKRAKK